MLVDTQRGWEVFFAFQQVINKYVENISYN